MGCISDDDVRRYPPSTAHCSPCTRAGRIRRRRHPRGCCRGGSRRAYNVRHIVSPSIRPFIHPFINLFLFFVSHAIRDYDPATPHHTTPQYTAPDQFRSTHPPRKAPTGLRAGSGASERTRAVAWKPRAAAVAGELRIRA